MDNKSGTNNPAISLPKGGGAIKGIGETFQPNLFTGTGNFSVPIFTSPGRNGFGPKLTLQYSTGNGNGPFGMGWQLSIPRITRKTEKGLPTYTDKDVFVMSGAEDLVPVLDDNGQPVAVDDQGNYSINRYQPRTEGLFARIEKWSNKNDVSDIFWRATTKENITSIYGRSSTAKITQPEKDGHVFEWLLEETFDAKGNHILYDYAQEDQDTDQLSSIYEKNRKYSQAYVRRILYGNTPDNLDAAKEVGVNRDGTDHLDLTKNKSRHYVFEVLFGYHDLPDSLTTGFNFADHITNNPPSSWPLRKDPFSSFRAGFEIRTLRRCIRKVLMLHHFKEGEVDGAPLVKSTDFAYHTNPDTQLSFLESVTVTGYKKNPQNPAQYFSKDMPPVTFKYSEFEPQKQKYQSVNAKGSDFPPAALSNQNFSLIDLYGDGLPDIINTTETGYYFWQNLGNGQLNRRHPQHGDLPAGVTLAQPNVAIGDMGGDGLPDLIVDAPPMTGFYEATPDGKWKNFHKIKSMPNFNLSDPNTRLVDLTGDGLADVLVTRDHFFLWFQCKGEEGYETPKIITRKHDLDEFPDVFFSDPSGRVRLADMTGDGLNDIVLVHDGRIDYWPNLGYGNFGRRITMANTPRIGYQFDPRRLFLADLDGTGCADLVYVDNGKVQFWFNQSGNGWSGEKVINGTPYVTDTTAIQFADFYGTGTSCLLWSHDYGEQPGSNYKILDFCGTKKPHLLLEISNNMGATTRAQYASSTKFYLEDKEKGEPWVTNLPFPVQVLEKTEVIDHISKSKLVTTYKYHHGYYDGNEREFRGFGRVDQYDTKEFGSFISSSLHGDAVAFDNNNKSFHVPPVLTKIWFHTGVYFDRNLPSATGVFYDEQDMMDAYKREYYKGDSKSFEIEDHIVNKDDTPHEAYRALRGSIIRSEVYALDGDNNEDNPGDPYTVSENRYEVRRLQKRFSNNHAVYLAKQKESISYHYERNPVDPRVMQQLTLEFDDWGNVIESATIGYPRRPDNAHYDEQREIKATYSWSQFINEDQQQNYYHVGINCEAKVFEVHGFNWQWPAGDAHPVPVKDADLAGITNNPDHFLPYLPTRPSNLAGIEKRIVDWKRIYFRKDVEPHLIDPVGNSAHRLNLDEIEALGLPYETYQVAFTNAILQTIYENRLERIDIASEGGYVQEGNYNGEDYWWIPSGRLSFDKNKFYHPQKSQDPFGNVTLTEIDDYALMVIKVTDALPGAKANIFQAGNNYRVLQPKEVTDPNNNRSQVAFDALGMVVRTAVMGEDENGPQVGDSLNGFDADLTRQQIDDHAGDPLNTNPKDILKNATTRLVYDLKRFMLYGEPNVVYSLQRKTHVHKERELGIDSRIQHSFVYSDGFGREAQTKIQAEPDPAIPGVDRWVGTGTKAYNNKGKPVQQYEPFFSDTHEFGIEKHGVSPTFFYDPLERVNCTIHPNHTYEKVVFDPWQQITWDANDTVLLRPHEDNDVMRYVEEFINVYRHPLDGRPFNTWYDELIPDRAHEPAHPTPEQRAALLTKAHAGTPSTVHLDTLGRPFLTVAHNGKDNGEADILLNTHVELDIEGNDLKIADPRQYELNEGRAANTKIHNFIHWFDIAGRKLRIDSVDAGLQLLFVDVVGKPLYTWDGVGRTKATYDVLRRPLEVWVKEKNEANFYLSHKTIYGEDKANPHRYNHRMQAWKVYDGAGLAESDKYDFKGNLVEQSRRLSDDGKIQVQWPSNDGIFSETQANDLLEAEAKKYVVKSEFDALNRIILSKAPDGTVQKPLYNEANLLDSLKVTVNGTEKIFVQHIEYNAKGQRTKIFYGEDAAKKPTFHTKYTYDPETFRLTNIRSQRKGSNDPDLQILSYVYDPVGNITGIKDDAHKLVFNRNNIIKPESKYTYDPLYRLVEAEGREHEAMTPCHYREGNKKNTEFIELTNQPSTNGQALCNYIEKYEYDKAGNIALIDHHNLTRDIRWKRVQGYDLQSNRIKSSKAGCTSESTFDFLNNHDDNGNITRMPHLPQLLWNFQNQLIKVQLNTGTNANRAYYQYDAGGQRVRKTVVKNGKTEERIYIGGYEIYTESNNSGVTLRRDTIHVMDDKNRIALIEIKKNPNDLTNILESRKRFQLSNHLGSSMLEVDDSANAKIITYEEYCPYGGTAYLAAENETEAKRKRYRYSGKERDDETGLYYYGARYYAPWIGRWISCDPAGIADGLNTYIFVTDNPISNKDNAGFISEPIGGPRDEGSINLNQGDTDRPGGAPNLPVGDLVKKTREELFAQAQDLTPEELWRLIDLGTFAGLPDPIRPQVPIEKTRADFLAQAQDLTPEESEILIDLGIFAGLPDPDPSRPAIPPQVPHEALEAFQKAESMRVTSRKRDDSFIRFGTPKFKVAKGYEMPHFKLNAGAELQLPSSSGYGKMGLKLAGGVPQIFDLEFAAGVQGYGQLNPYFEMKFGNIFKTKVKKYSGKPVDVTVGTQRFKLYGGAVGVALEIAPSKKLFLVKPLILFFEFPIEINLEPGLSFPPIPPCKGVVCSPKPYYNPVERSYLH